MFITHEDGQFFTVSFGRGSRTVVGIGGWIGNWAVWADVFGVLSSTYRTVGIDHRGTGATLAPTRGVTIEKMADDLLAVLDKLRITSCVLAAESSGGAVALSAASKQPERFEGLVLSGTFYFRPHSDVPDSFLVLLERDYENAISLFIRNSMPETVDPAMHHWGRQVLAASQEAALDLYRATLGLDLRPLLLQVSTPALLLHGEADHIVPLASSQWLETQLPNGRLHTLPNAGHAPMMTYPDHVAQVIDRFCASFAP